MRGLNIKTVLRRLFFDLNLTQFSRGYLNNIVKDFALLKSLTNQLIIKKGHSPKMPFYNFSVWYKVTFEVVF